MKSKNTISFVASFPILRSNLNCIKPVGNSYRFTGEENRCVSWKLPSAKNKFGTSMTYGNDAHVNKSTEIDYVSLSASATSSSVAFVISNFEADNLLKLRKHAPKLDGEHALISDSFCVDLGLREISELYLTSSGIKLDDKCLASKVALTWEELKKMSKKGRSGAFEVYNDGETEPRRISAVSDETGLVSSLMPVCRNGAPTLVLSGFTMHRVSKGVDPYADTRAKLQALSGALRGHVLDICTGLGYTALHAAREESVSYVVTVERDAMVYDMIQRNPWSKELVAQAEQGRVALAKGDAEQVVGGFNDETFDVVIHDPPAIAISAGGLYGSDFYAQLFRVAKRGGMLFHYIGDPSSKESGRLFKGVMQRLRDVGFQRVSVDECAFGITAFKL